MRLRRADPHTLAGAYALDALADRDTAAFERHLTACEPCRQEAASLREAAARLGTSAAVTPPLGLREQVLARAARTRQLPPARAEAKVRMAGGGAAWARGRRLTPRLAVAAASLGVAAAAIVGVLAFNMQRHLSQDESHGTQLAAVLTAPDATMVNVHARTGGTATIVMSHIEGALVITTANLPALPSAERYEVWLMGPVGVRSRGMLPDPHRGMTAPMIVSGLARGDRIGVTVEPSGGARRPTSDPLVMIGLSS